MNVELCWLQMLLKDLGIFLLSSPTIWCDNVSAISLASNPIFHTRTKHIDVNYHFIRKKMLNKDIQVGYLSTINQPADIFTIFFASGQAHGYFTGDC